MRIRNGLRCVGRISIMIKLLCLSCLGCQAQEQEKFMPKRECNNYVRDESLNEDGTKKIPKGFYFSEQRRL